MALTDGGLDAQVGQRMDAYRGNPEKLKQRYGQNKELLDLLALQKLTSEKKAAAADMQLKAQQDPNTIAQQREQEALGLIKQEMSGTLGELAGRTAGTLGQKQKMQQKNMQRMAQAASKPPSGIAGLPGLMGKPTPRPNMPQAGGLAGARMAQTARQPSGPVRMAQGGIVAFAGGEEVNSSPYGRGLKNLKNLFKGNPELQEKNALAERVATKFAKYANFPGGFRNQSDAQRKYAKKVMSYIRSIPGAMGMPGGFETTLPIDVLKKLDAVNFDSALDSTEIAALPQISPSASSEPEVVSDAPVSPAAVTDPSGGLPEGSPSTGGKSSITYEVPDYKTEMSQLPDDVLNVPVQTVETADRSKLDAAQAELLAIAGDTPDAYVPEEFERTELKPVDPESYLDDQGLEARRAVLQRGADMMGVNVNDEIGAARASADAYSGRARKAGVYDAQLAKEQALQDRMMDPKRVAQLKRLQTFGGGAKYGRGGIGQAFVESEKKFDDLESGGLKTLRGIQDKGISVDNALVTEGMRAGANAGTRAQQDRMKGLDIAGTEVTRQKDVALDQQKGQQAVDTANTNATNIALGDKYRVDAAAQNEESATRREVVRAETAAVRAEADRLVRQSANEQDAAIQSAKNKVEQAREADSFAAEKARIQLLDIQATEKLFYEQRNALLAEKNAILDMDMDYKELTQKVAESEGTAELAKAKKAAENYADFIEAGLAKRFASDYARLAELKARFEQLRAQNIYTQRPSSNIAEDDPDVTVSRVE